MPRGPRLVYARPEPRLARLRRWVGRRLRISGRALGIAAGLLLAGTAAFWPEADARLLGSPAPTVEGVARVIDGDTLEIRGQRIRLHGIDAPEHDQRCRDARGRTWTCGRRARRELQNLAGHRYTACYRRDVDRYGRLVARCLAGERDLALQLVRHGLAVAYLRYSWDYVLPQIEAWADARGLWAGDFDMPEDWRRRHG